MDQILSILDENLEYVEEERLYGENIIYVKSRQTDGICPYCGQPSRRTHSTYDKRFLDFMIGNTKVKIILMNRKLFCDNPDCKHTTFAQKLYSTNQFKDKLKDFMQAYEQCKCNNLKVG